MSEQVVTEWAVDYGDGNGPIRAEDEFTASNWVKHWNTYRDTSEPARLMSRTVTRTEWQATS